MQTVPYRIRNMASRKLLANPQGSRSNGTPMIQWEDTGETDQEWSFDPPLGQAR
jgi:Ricin-type beta-trefoil lectin domain-like